MKVFYKTNVHSETVSGSPRVARKRRARKERILRAAMELAASDGLERLTVTRLAEHLDYTAAALYRYFPSKDALLAEMQRAAICSIEAELASAAAAVGPPGNGDAAALVPVCAIAERFLALLATRPHDIQLINFLLADPRNLITDDEVAVTAGVLARVLAAVEAVVDRAARDGALAPGSASDRTVMLWTSLQSATQLAKMRRFDPGRFDPRAVGSNLYRSLLLGWGADPGALDRAITLCRSESDHGGHPH